MPQSGEMDTDMTITSVKELQSYRDNHFITFNHMARKDRDILS